MTHDASHSYIYDAENRITAVDGGATATYSYNGEGQRSRKMVAGVATDYVYNLGGLVMAEVGSGSTWQREYVYLGRQLVAEYENGTTYFVHGDHLGSTRLLTGYPTASVVECDDYYPFGESIGCGATGTTTHKFTGYERDSESNLDNAQARYNSSSLGRFMSPDPIGNFVADSTNPQTWNLYTYALNNPLRYVDPSGLDGFDYYDCIGSGNDASQCGAPPPCTADTCVYVYDLPNQFDPPYFPPDQCTTANPCFTAPSGGGGGGNNSGVANNGPVVVQNPCQFQGRALPPSAYAASGQQARNSTTDFVLDVTMGFPAGHYLDAQPLASGNVFQRQAYGNYTFGVYMAAAGVSLNTALSGANTFAFFFSSYSKNTPMDPNHGSLPAASVANITNGYNAYPNGTVCHN
jgi:RHS repeat-associated protein